MIVDRPKRDRLINAINRYVSGKIKSDWLDDEVFDSLGKHPDRAVAECATYLWGTYDDFSDHSLFPDPITLLRMKRVVAFLASDLEYSHRSFSLIPIFNRNKEIVKPYWPFASQSQWRAYRNFAKGFEPDEGVLIVSHARR